MLLTCVATSTRLAGGLTPCSGSRSSLLPQTTLRCLRCLTPTRVTLTARTNKSPVLGCRPRARYAHGRRPPPAHHGGQAADPRPARPASGQLGRGEWADRLTYRSAHHRHRAAWAESARHQVLAVLPRARLPVLPLHDLLALGCFLQAPAAAPCAAGEALPGPCCSLVFWVAESSTRRTSIPWLRSVEL